MSTPTIQQVKAAIPEASKWLSYGGIGPCQDQIAMVFEISDDEAVELAYQIITQNKG